MVESLCMRCKDLCTWSYVCCVAGQPAVAGQTSRRVLALSKNSLSTVKRHATGQVGRSDASRDETSLAWSDEREVGCGTQHLVIQCSDSHARDRSTKKGAKHSPRSSRPRDMHVEGFFGRHFGSRHVTCMSTRRRSVGTEHF